MRKYDSYKDSGIEWIGEIPEHWEVKKLKHLTFIGNGRDHKDVWDENGKYPIMGTGGKFGNSNTFLHNKPSVLLGRKGTIDNPVYIDEPFWAVDTVYFTISKKDTNTKYLFYLTKTINFDLYKYGSAVPSMNQEVLKEIYFSIPPTPEEQTAIANYLDRKTAEIDELIADKKRLLELYEEEKTAIINQAVTKGLPAEAAAQAGINPNVPMKDSGIEWLGEIPEHWEVKRLKYVAILRSGNNIVSEQIKETGEYPVYGGNGLRGYFSEYTHDGKHVLIGRQGAYCGNIKYGNGKFWASEHAVVVTALVNYEMVYLGELLRTMKLGQYSVSAAQPGLAVDAIKNLIIPFPPPEEQQSIVNHIESECARIDAKTENTKKLIDLLTEYRTALISEVVTGKIKVI